MPEEMTGRHVVVLNGRAAFGAANGPSQEETDRPGGLPNVLAPLTRALFEKAGLEPGMRVLDIGSGAGDTALLAATLVGAGGCVVGVERDAGVLEVARRRARAARFANVSFWEGDFRALPVEEPFDAVVGRLILMYQPDPVAALRALLPQVRPGGLVVCHEPDLHAPVVVPPSALLAQVLDWLTAAAARDGVEPRMGPTLYAALLAAGLPTPAMTAEAIIGGGVGFPGYVLWADLVNAMLPAIERHGIATAAEVEVETLADRLCAEVVAGGGSIATPVFVGAWSRRR